ncbi:hypothetical protein RHMOL_Rhmol13G0212300 [Rhododendron molle]|uniref:Uncharacterized protein n=1 Tax=Rhododendron molle TaxID=49168 RepID=A0ACC0L9Y6_RHOML|nr:hypothetical protein RHMOL_Rhmol13G0212300 [Rhododendron molle]
MEPCIQSGGDGHVGVPQHALVEPDRDPLRPGAPFHYISGSENDTFLTHGDGDIAAAEEEALGDVGWAAAGGETVKAVGCVVGVGGENGEEGVEVCLVGAVWGVGTGCAKMFVGGVRVEKKYGAANYNVSYGTNSFAMTSGDSKRQ